MSAVPDLGPAPQLAELPAEAPPPPPEYRWADWKPALDTLASEHDLRHESRRFQATHALHSVVALMPIAQLRLLAADVVRATEAQVTFGASGSRMDCVHAIVDALHQWDARQGD